MKICFLTDSLDPSEGPGRYAREIVAALRPHTSQRAVIVAAADTAVADASLPGCTVHRLLPARRTMFLSRPLLYPLVAAAALRILPIVRKADVVHALKDYPYSVIAAAACWMGHRPLVVTAHGSFSVIPFHSSLERPLLRFVYRQAARIISVSEYTRRRLGEHIETGSVVVIPNGVNYERFGGDLAAPRSAEHRFLLSVGQLKERKGFDVVVRAFQQIAPDFPGVRYYIAGNCRDEPYVRQLRALIGRDGDSIQLLGAVDDDTLRRLYRDCELFVLAPRTDRAGRFEGFGLVYLEAGACAKPVIGTSGCGAEDAIVDGQTGLLVRPDDVKDLARALRTLLNDRDLARRLGEGGRRRAQELSWRHIAEWTAAVYREVVER